MKIYVAGHTGMVGSAVFRKLRNVHDIVVPESNGTCAGSRGPDLRSPTLVHALMQELVMHRPTHVPIGAVIGCAARVGGIGANVARPVEFLADNVLIGTNLLAAAHEAGIQTFVNLGSSCIYPRHCPQPMNPHHLLSGPLEPTNEGYAIAKIAVLRLAQYYQREYGRRYVSVMPTNLYGTGDRYDAARSHVLPALIMKFEHARALGVPVTLWGTGKPLREFLHVDDLADAIAVVLDRYHGEAPINVGSGVEVTIEDLAMEVARATGFTGQIRWDNQLPDGTPRKLLDSSEIRALGWAPKIGLVEGIERTVEEYRRGHPRR